MVSGALVTHSQPEEIDTSRLIDLLPNGLVFLGSETFVEWSAIGAHLQRAAGSINWWLGDWLNRGESRFGETYAQAIEQSGLAYSTLGNIKWVARAIPLSRRREELTWKHHAEVAGIGSELEQDDWLALAAEQSWSANTLRKEIKATKVDSVRLVEVDPSRSPTVQDSLGTWADDEREEGDQRVSDALDAEYEVVAPVVWPGSKKRGGLSDTEKSIAWLAIQRIDEYEARHYTEPGFKTFATGVLVGVDIAAPDWGNDLPGLITRYRRLRDAVAVPIG